MKNTYFAYTDNLKKSCLKVAKLSVYSCITYCISPRDQASMRITITLHLLYFQTHCISLYTKKQHKIVSFKIWKYTKWVHHLSHPPSNSKIVDSLATLYSGHLGGKLELVLKTNLLMFCCKYF